MLEKIMHTRAYRKYTRTEHLKGGPEKEYKKKHTHYTEENPESPLITHLKVIYTAPSLGLILFGNWKFSRSQDSCLVCLAQGERVDHPFLCYLVALGL